MKKNNSSKAGKPKLELYIGDSPCPNGLLTTIS